MSDALMIRDRFWYITSLGYLCLAAEIPLERKWILEPQNTDISYIDYSVDGLLPSAADRGSIL
jgi:hypothetical protein